MKRFIPILFWLVALLIIAFALLRFESDLLWKVQQYNLFLDTPLFFREQMVVPGGFLSYVSCFFTQFFYYPWLGVLILCGWWLLLMWLIKRTFCIENKKILLTLIPVAILLIASMCLGYWHYFIKLRGYFFVATIGTTVAVAMLWAFRKATTFSLSKGRLWVRIAIILATAVVGYPLFGIYALAAVLLMGIWTWRLSDKRTQNAILTVVALLCIVAIPLFYYRYVYYQTNISEMWTAALPSFTIEETYSQYYIPYYILGAFFLLMMRATPNPSMKKGGLKLKPLYLWGLQGIIAIALVGCVYHYWYKDENFHHELAMQRFMEQAEWEDVLRETMKQEVEPTRPIVVMRNIALARVGLQLDEMYNFPRGYQTAKTPLPYDMMYHVFGRLIYYQYGMLNDCHRLCMEEGVEHGWHVEIQKYMARCSLLSGEKQAARKNLNLLHHTLFHGKWADEMLQLLDNPKLMAENQETGPVMHMLHYNNALGSDGGKVERYVMNQLANQDSNDPYFQEQALLAALWTRNPQMFFPRFSKYATQHQREPMPHLFQEAAYLFGKLRNMPNVEQFPFDPSVKKTYNAFMNDLKKYEGQNPEIGRNALLPFYGSTYFYEYYFGVK